MALTVFKTVRDLTLSGWVGSIPMHSRQSRSRADPGSEMMHSTGLARTVRAFALASFVGACWSRGLGAQQRDTTARVPIPTRIQRDTAKTAAGDSAKAPLSPRRAFLYSFLLPGYSQSILRRHRAGALFMLTEAISIVMIRESGADLREARRFSGDSIVLSYVDDNGAPLAAPQARAGRFGATEVRSREAHVEDWIALLIANHLFAGADAFVAANLWDVPAKLGLRVAPGAATVSASVAW